MMAPSPYICGIVASLFSRAISMSSGTSGTLPSHVNPSRGIPACPALLVYSFFAVIFTVATFDRALLSGRVLIPLPQPQLQQLESLTMRASSLLV